VISTRLARLSVYRHTTLIAALVATAVLAGCSSATLQVRGVAPLNLNEAAESTPVDVRFYQLRDDAALKRAPFEKLWTEDEKVLGQDRLAPPKVISVLPGNATDQPARIALGELAAGTRFIGIMALYAKTDARDSRIVVLPVGEAEKPVIEFSGYGIALVRDDQPREAKPASGTKGK
jgi:type VI secretion system VasD/TssJ family lipoprotein